MSDRITSALDAIPPERVRGGRMKGKSKRGGGADGWRAVGITIRTNRGVPAVKILWDWTRP